MARTLYACEDCGKEWGPTPPTVSHDECPTCHQPVENEQSCTACGGRIERVDPLLVTMLDLVETLAERH